MNAKATSLLVGGLTVALFTVAAAAGEAATVASARSDAHAARAVVAPAPAGRYGYVAGGRLLSVIDAANPAIVARIALGAGATGTLAAHPAGTLVYVVTDDAIAAVDTRSRTVVATVPADGVGALLVHPDGSRLYAAGRIALAGAAALPSLLVIDTQTNAVTANLALPAASSASGMTMLPDGSRLYVANRFSGCCDGSVSVLDTATQQITTEIPLAVRGPLTADPTGASVYAASAGGISIIDTATDAVTATLPFSPEPFPTIVASAIAFDPSGAHAYVATYSTGAGFGGSDGWVRVIDTARQAFVVNIELDQIPTAMVLNPSGSRIYVSGQVPGLAARPTQVRPAGVAVIDALTRGVIATVPPVSPEPYTVVPASLAFNAATAAVYPGLPSISIDHGVMEHARDVVAVTGELGWSDVGSWAAVAELTAPDARGNAVVGDAVIVDGGGNLVVTDPGTVVALVGVSGLAVVRAGDAVLVLPLDRAQDVRAAVDALAAAGLDRAR